MWARSTFLSFFFREDNAGKQCRVQLQYKDEERPFTDMGEKGGGGGGEGKSRFFFSDLSYPVPSPPSHLLTFILL